MPLPKLPDPSASLSKYIPSPLIAAANEMVLDSTFNHASSPKEMEHIGNMNLSMCTMVYSPFRAPFLTATACGSLPFLVSMCILIHHWYLSMHSMFCLTMRCPLSTKYNECTTNTHTIFGSNVLNLSIGQLYPIKILHYIWYQQWITEVLVDIVMAETNK